MDSQVKSPTNFPTTTHRPKSTKNLQTGDVYITRHSNLSQVHVVFHIVTDDSLLSKEINSRHPVLLGLRNILKTACSNDITSLTIPLLLQYDMTEVCATFISGQCFFFNIKLRLFKIKDKKQLQSKGILYIIHY